MPCPAKVLSSWKLRLRVAGHILYSGGMSQSDTADGNVASAQYAPAAPTALRVLEWLAGHRVVAGSLVAAYSLLIIFSHEWIQQTVRGWYGTFTRDRVNTWVHAGMVVLVVFFARFLWRALTRPPDRAIKCVFLALTFGLMAGSWKWLFYTDVEVVHYPQYAILAMLIFPLARCHWRTVFYATFIGFVDEVVQFYVYNPWPVHLDFNDMFYNQIGAGLGCVMIWLAGGNVLVRPRLRQPLTANILKLPPVWLVLMVAVVCTVLTLRGQMTLDPPSIGPKPRFVVRRQGPSRTYWKDNGFGKTFHDLTIPEAIAGSVGLLVFFGSINLLNRRSHSSLGEAWRDGADSGISRI